MLTPIFTMLRSLRSGFLFRRYKRLVLVGTKTGVSSFSYPYTVCIIVVVTVTYYWQTDSSGAVSKGVGKRIDVVNRETVEDSRPAKPFNDDEEKQPEEEQYIYNY